GDSGRAARRGRVAVHIAGPGYPGPSNLPKARTFVRAFAFIGIFMVTMRPSRRTNSGCLRFDRRGAGLALDCARRSEIERFRSPKGCCFAREGIRLLRGNPLVKGRL